MEFLKKILLFESEQKWLKCGSLTIYGKKYICNNCTYVGDLLRKWLQITILLAKLCPQRVTVIAFITVVL